MTIETARAELLSRIHAEHYTTLVRLGVLLLRDQGRAEEVVQDAFVALYQHWDRLGTDVDAPAYLRTSVVNRSRSALRHLSVVRRKLPRLVGDHQPHPGADHDVLAAERRQHVLDALAALPQRQREVLSLRYFLELSERETAATLGISTGAVKSHTSRGMAALRRDHILSESTHEGA